MSLEGVYLKIGGIAMHFITELIW